MTGSRLTGSRRTGSRLTGSRMTRWLPELLTAIGLVIAPYVLPSLGFSPDTANRILVWGLFGLGFDILFGYTGLLSFGQSAFFGTGGFIAAYLLTNNIMSNVILALVLGTLGAMVAGLFVGAIALRRTGIYFAMITVAIAEVFFFMENSPLSDWTGGENGLPGVPAPSFQLGSYVLRVGTGWSMFGFLAVCFFLGLVVARMIIRSPVGAILVAIRDNPDRAQALGHAVWRYKLTAFVIASAYAGFAGGLLGVLQGYMPPEAFTFDTSGQLVMQTVIGGSGTLFGPLVGATVWLYLRDFLQGPVGLGSAWRLALGLVFVLLVCFLRRGLIGGISDLYARVFAKPHPAAPEEAPAVDFSTQSLASVGPAARQRVPSGNPGAPILEARGLSKRYGGLMANRELAFTVREGELRGVIGPNGAGKSTFFKMLTCEVQPTSGRILFHGGDITGLSVCRVCQLGLTKSYQINQLFGRLTVRQNVEIAALAERRGRFRLDLFRRLDHVPGLSTQVQQTLALVGLSARAEVPVSELAYGEKRRLEIGLALATSPTLLLLDEPLAGMSPRERAETVQLLKNVRRGRTLVIVEHDMDALFELAERVTVLHEGTILAEGTPAEIQRNSLVQDAYLGGVAAA
jgi:branched-chain amino acid transport system permease protein